MARDTARRLIEDANALDYTSQDIWYGEGPAELVARLAALSPRQRRKYERHAFPEEA